MIEIGGLKYISPLDDEKRIGKDIECLEEYGLVEENSREILKGHLPKRFVRLSSSYFMDYINEIKNNPNSSYETYLDRDLIRGDYVPRNFSVLIKYDTNDLAYLKGEINDVLPQITSELCAPVIMNELGVKTVYNSILIEHSGYAQYVLSIDAVKPNEEVFCLENFMSCIFSGWIETGLDIVKHYVEDLLKRECGVPQEQIKGSEYQQKIKELQDEFMVRYLANVVVLGNCDYNARNYAFLVNKKTKEIRTFPCFDYEFCFNGCFFKNQVKENVKIIRERNPKLLESFALKLRELIKCKKNGSSRLYEVLKKTLDGVTEKGIYDYIISQNIESFFDVYKDVVCDEKTNLNQLKYL